MINFDSLSLKALVAELSPLLTGGKVSRIKQPSRHELLLPIRAGRENHRLYITVDPKYPHFALLSKEGEELRCIENPKTPPMFCMLLRKHMEGSKIKKIKQPKFERILEIYFDSYSEIGERVQMVLSCEFMGKSSNIILYNYETNVILGCAHNVSSEKSRERELAGGLPYICPPKQDKIDITAISEQEFHGLLREIPMEKFGYISRALGSELIKACNKQDLYRVAFNIVSLKGLNPAISRDKRFYSLAGLDKSIQWEAVDTVNRMIDLYFGYQVFEDKVTKQKNILEKHLKKQIKIIKNLAEKQKKLIKSEEKQTKYKQLADEIVANLYKEDGGADIREAQKYYKLYKKAKAAASYAEELLKTTENEIEYLESVQASINQAETLHDLRQIQDELGLDSPKKHTGKDIELAEFVSSDGFRILAGKNNRQNEFILKNALPEDIWLHVQNMPGSHVVIKAAKDREIPETTLHEAVYIAAYYSQGRFSSNVPVVFTKRKYVKKPTGAKPGFVVYNNERTLWVNPEEEKVLALRKR